MISIPQTIILAVIFGGTVYFGYLIGRGRQPKCYFCDGEGSVIVRVGNELASVQVHACDEHHEVAASLAERECKAILRSLGHDKIQGLLP